MQPPREVLAAFGAVGPEVKLDGGRGAAWRAGDLVLKPLDVLPAELAWLRRHAPAGRDDLRLSLPARSRTGELVVDGWTAFPVLQGEHVAGRWAQIAGVAHCFAQSFDGAERPPFLDERTHAWARADRLAWGEDARWRCPTTSRTSRRCSRPDVASTSPRRSSTATSRATCCSPTACRPP